MRAGARAHSLGHSGAQPLICAIVNDSVENWRPIADDASFFPKFGVFGPKMRQKAVSEPMNPLSLPRAGGCKGGFWAMIMVRLGPVSAGQPAERGSRGAAAPKGHHGSLNRNTSPRD